MRSFPVPAAPLALATKISLGSKKDDSSKSGTSQAKQSIPSGLPLSTTRLVSSRPDVVITRTVGKRGKEKVSKTDV